MLNKDKSKPNYFSLFALKNKMLHKICHLTFPAVSQSIEWAIRMRLDSTSQITLVPSRSTPGSPVVNRLVSDKHFDSTSVNHKHDIDLTFSVCLIGPPRSGKSNIVQRFVYNSYQELYQKTIGADFHQKDVRLNHKNLRLQMWDFGKGFETIVEDHLVSARCVIAVFDHTSRSSLESLSNMLDEYSGVLSDKVLVIAGTKSDLNETDIRKSSEIQCVAERFSAIGWFPVSSKTGEGVENMLVDCCIMVMQTENFEKKDYTHERNHGNRRSIGEIGNHKQSSTCTII